MDLQPARPWVCLQAVQDDCGRESTRRRDWVVWGSAGVPGLWHLDCEGGSWQTIREDLGRTSSRSGEVDSLNPFHGLSPSATEGDLVSWP